MHCSVSGCGDNLATDDADAIEQARLYFSYLPTCWREAPPEYPAEAPAAAMTRDLVPERFDCRAGAETLVLEGYRTRFAPNSLP